MGSSWIIHIGFKSHIVAVVVQLLSHFCLFVTPWTVAHQGPLSMRFPRQEYWNGFPFPSPGDLLNPHLLHCRWILYCWATQKALNPRIKEEATERKKRKPPRQRRDWSKGVTRNIVATGKTMEDSFLEPPKIAQPSDTSISGSSLQDYERIQFCCSKPPCLW